MSELTWTPTRVRLADLAPWERNPKRMSKAQAARLEASTGKLGRAGVLLVGPPDADGKRPLYDGHQRAKVWGALYGPATEVVALEADRTLTDEERRATSLLTVTAAASFDWDALASWDVGELVTWGLDTDLLAQWNDDAANLREMIEAEAIEPPADPGPQIDRAEELREKWGVEPGQLWRLGEHRLICGDCTDADVVARVMGGETPGLVLADPPYGVEIVDTHKAKGTPEADGALGFVGAEGIVEANAYAPIVGDDTTDTARLFYDLCVTLGYRNMVLWGGNYFSDFLPPHSCWIVWDKREDVPSNNFADCELAWTSFDSPARIYRQLWSGLLRKGDRETELVRRVHPTQKPVGVHEKIIADLAPGDGVVFDGFVGSGTTLIACERLGRKCRAVELSPAYCSVTLQRWADMTGGTPELVETMDIQLREAPDFTEQNVAREAQYVPDAIFPSDNEWDVPALLSELQADFLELPFTKWGDRARKHKMLGTYHFYTDDYKFEALWKDPLDLVNSACVAIVEPNVSTNDQMPTAIALWRIYRKRWLARYLQEFGVKVWVDLNVDPKWARLNLLGVPRGWRSFCTRGLDRTIDDLQTEYDIAREMAAPDAPRFLVYGGGKAVEMLCKERGWQWLPENMRVKEGKAEADYG